MPRALAVTPAAAGLLMAAVAVDPTPTSVGLAEVLRKVRRCGATLLTAVSLEWWCGLVNVLAVTTVAGQYAHL